MGYTPDTKPKKEVGIKALIASNYPIDTSMKNGGKAQVGSQSAIIKTLVFVWFALCTSLVTKHNDMIAVFYSFSGSFILAVSIALTQNRNIGAAFSVETLTTSQRTENSRTKALVGIVACATSLLLLSMKSPKLFGDYNKYSLMGIQVIRKSPEFHALANMSGFLGFHLWYDRLYCRLFPPHLLQILEDAVTLSLFSVILTKWEVWRVSSSVYATSAVALWLFYKTFQFAHEVLHNEEDKLIEGTDTTPSKPCSPKEILWTIHGEDYDLNDFIHRHPGGKEAILLGRGRDCTALFESYHPFTTRHRYGQCPSPIIKTQPGMRCIKILTILFRHPTERY